MRLGLTELIFIFGIILIVFGPTKLPTLGKSMGEAIKNFKDGLNKVEVKDENTRLKTILETILNTAKQV